MNETVQSPHHRSGRKRKASGGRKKSANARCARMAFTCYPADARDLEVLGAAWDVPYSTLAWAVVHDWLQRARGASSDLGEVRGPLRMVIELALRDRELGEWLRGVIAERPLG
jgi:hypothetical protein